MKTINFTEAECAKLSDLASDFNYALAVISAAFFAEDHEERASGTERLQQYHAAIGRVIEQAKARAE